MLTIGNSERIVLLESILIDEMYDWVIMHKEKYDVVVMW